MPCEIVPLQDATIIQSEHSYNLRSTIIDCAIQKSKATTHKASGLDESAYSGAKTVFEGQATGEENFKADETYHWRIAPKSESVRN